MASENFDEHWWQSLSEAALYEADFLHVESHELKKKRYVWEQAV